MNKTLLAATAAASLGWIGHAQANLVINASFDSSITGDANAAAITGTISTAVASYETLISTSITVAINFALGGGLGSSSTYYAPTVYSDYLAALQSHGSGDATDTAALASIPNTSTDPVTGGTAIDVKTANLRAVGFNVAPPVGSPDGFITLNTTLTTPPGSSSNLNLYSLLAVTQHEIDEVLGLSSGLTAASAGTILPEDLFRYSAPGTRSYTTTNGATAYLSVNGGTTDLAPLHNSPDGADYGDFATGPTPQVQDAYGTPGSSPTLGPNELIALDAIGYNLTAAGLAIVNGTASVPEPASVLLLGAGLAGLARTRRRRTA